jgi:hypothetical protein
VLEDKMPKRIFGSNKEVATGGRRKLHNEELHTLFNLISILSTQLHYKLDNIEHNQIAEI